jgi:hypothetical protein
MEASILWADAIALGVTLPDEEKWAMIRDFRNRALYHSDWTQLADVPITRVEQITYWRTYRQTLRDLTELYATPDEVIFPTPPEGELV